METMKKEAIVLYPCPYIGHLISTVELGRLFLTLRPSITIHVLISAPPPTEGPAAAATTASFISSVSATDGSSISFHKLPHVALPPGFSVRSAIPEVTKDLEVLRLDTPNVRSAIESISEGHHIRALVIDLLCPYALPVARELSIPCYYNVSSSISSLAFMVYLDTFDKLYPKSFNDHDRSLIIEVPGIPPMQPLDMPCGILDRDDHAYDFFFETTRNFKQAHGVIVNSFEKCEPRAFRDVVAGICTPSCTMPPLYCIGPLITTRDCAHRGPDKKDVPECLKWLDDQPSKSVIFLSFGSSGVFSKEQLMETAVGLERSGLRFLWVVRNPRDLPDTDLDMLLPDGFLERTKKRGLVVKSWAPQGAVLNHGSVGGFVTHCGWNSILESITAGVPMITWPLYAEQRLNRLVLVKETKVALSMNASEEGLVTAVEVEARVRELMDSEIGKSVRERTLMMKAAAEAALSPNGSSRAALNQLVDSWNIGS
ncbi:hypothetical protein SAY87_025379 [Trapa incisa]|uniref:Glycosyltransferase n=1 Tax=Trapa incisa TaxID=236973 RepID=A0AAN7GB59_9MYRT|nr:hypothetical protein SAY87_025379 [Trapa incisa]